jgi:hypothetical protein
MIIVLMFVISMVQILSEGPLRRSDEVLVNGLCLVGVLVLAVLAGYELARARKPVLLRIVGGIFLLLFAIGLAVVLGMGMVPTGGLRFLLALVILWFGLAGVRDLVVP